MKRSRIVNIYNHIRTILERVLEKMSRYQVTIDGIQFSFMPGKETDAIFIM